MVFSEFHFLGFEDLMFFCAEFNDGDLIYGGLT